ncbi:MAG: hypothetical protein WBD40_16225 [Tepidisphaeraceae bacterium]
MPTDTAKTEAASPSLDYVLLGSDDANALEGAATILRGAGLSAKQHDLGLRVDCRGVNWKGALGQLSAALSTAARRGLRVALIPISADVLAFQRALLMSQPLDAFVATLAPRATAPATAACGIDSHAFGDVFKGQSLE